MYCAVWRHFSRVQLCMTPWTIAHQAPLSMGFPRQECWSRLPCPRQEYWSRLPCPRQEYWSGLPCPPSGDLPNPEIKPASLMSPALAGGFFTTNATWEVHWVANNVQMFPAHRSGGWKSVIRVPACLDSDESPLPG